MKIVVLWHFKTPMLLGVLIMEKQEKIMFILVGCYYRFQGRSLVECQTLVRGVGDSGFIMVSLDRI
jgi:hypothetical protein